jgi:hypothetical protein
MAHTCPVSRKRHASNSAPTPPRIASAKQLELEVADHSCITTGPAAVSQQQALLSILSTLGATRISDCMLGLKSDLGILEEMKQREQNGLDYSYILKQTQIDYLMRAILLDWMMEVSREFSLGRETLHLALNIVDRFLSQVYDLPRNHLQLLGVAALFITSKLDVSFIVLLCA